MMVTKPRYRDISTVLPLISFVVKSPIFLAAKLNNEQTDQCSTGQTETNNTVTGAISSPAPR